MVSRSSFALGHVNDLETELFGKDGDDEQDDETLPAQQQRQTSGTELIASSSKWHPHTVKVFEMLKRHMPPPSDEEVEEKQVDMLSYHQLSQGCSRRTAAGVFFELLQLKTWDFIDLEQDDAFGDILVTRGAKYKEDPPSSDISESPSSPSAPESTQEETVE